MKAVLLCAGEGTRLRPLTLARPKHLLPVAGRAVLDLVLCDLAEAGVDEAIFVVSPEGRLHREFVGDGSRWGMAASFVVQPEPRGLADALSWAREEVGDERFLMYLADDLLEEGVSDFSRSFFEGHAAASLIVKSVEDPRRFGVVVVEDECVTRLVEKPKQPPSDLAIVGVYGLGPEIWPAIDSIELSARGELEITDAIDHLVSTGRRVECHPTAGFWADAGSPEALLRANRFFLGCMERRIDGDVDGASSVEGRVHVGAGARVTSSELLGPCLIGEDCVIEGSRIGPNASLGAECSVRDAAIEDSILDEGCRIEGVRPGLARAILGRRVAIRNVAGVGSAPLGLLLADDSVVIAGGE